MRPDDLTLVNTRSLSSDHLDMCFILIEFGTIGDVGVQDIGSTYQKSTSLIAHLSKATKDTICHHLGKLSRFQTKLLQT